MIYSQVPNNQVFYFVGNPNYPKLKTLQGHWDIRDSVSGQASPDAEVELASSEVKLTYFKANGTYYTEGSFNFEGSPSYSQLIHSIRYWRFHHASPLPGLSSREWDGYILVVPQRDDLKVPTILDNLLKGSS